MSAQGLGRVKTLALVARVESSRRNSASWSQIVLGAWRSMPCWRIAFSTFRRCMSFHTAWVRLGPAYIARLVHPDEQTLAFYSLDGRLVPLADVSRCSNTMRGRPDLLGHLAASNQEEWLRHPDRTYLLLPTR